MTARKTDGNEFKITIMHGKLIFRAPPVSSEG